MKALHFTALASLLGVGCSAPVPQGEALAEPGVAYLCETGKALVVHFSPEHNVAVLVRHGSSLELPQRPAASGFLYSNGAHTVRGKGSELMLEVGRMAPIRCEAR